MEQRVEQTFEDALPVGANEDPFRKRLARDVANGFAWFIHHATWRMRLLEYAWPMVERELSSTVRVPWYIKPSIWWRGFLSESWVLYDLRNNDWRDYLSDSARYAKSRLINGAHGILLDDKLAFQRFLEKSSGHLVPTIYGIISKGQITTPCEEVPHCRSARWLGAQVREHGRLVIKPSGGGGGRDVLTLRLEGETVCLNGRPVGEADLLCLVAGSDGHMVCEHVSQHPDLARIYPHATNTVRVLLMQDDCCHPFIAAAVLRVGTSRSAPTDNWRRGGLSAEVDRTDGIVTKAAPFPAHRDSVVWYSHHPETGEAIAGLRIPNWDEIKRGLTDLMRSLPMFRYVGWDVVVTPEGFRILEGNNFSNVNLIQIHRPLLRDERVAAFYRRNGVLPRGRPQRVAARQRHKG